MSDLAPPASIRVDPDRFVGALWFTMLWLAALVVVLDVWLWLGEGVASPDLAGFFDATSERGLSSWIAVTQTSLIALTLWGVVVACRAAERPRRSVLGWACLAVLFSYLALDDGTYLHERVGSALGDAEASAPGIGAHFPSYYWQLALGPVFAAAGLAMLLFLRREVQSPRARRRVAGAVVLIIVAVALDFVDGLGDGHPLDLYAYLAERWLPDATAYALFDTSGLDAVVHLSRALEESVEIIAFSLLWTAFLLHAAETLPRVNLQWSTAEVADVADDKRSETALATA